MEFQVHYFLMLPHHIIHLLQNITVIPTKFPLVLLHMPMVYLMNMQEQTLTKKKLKMNMVQLTVNTEQLFLTVVLKQSSTQLTIQMVSLLTLNTKVNPIMVQHLTHQHTGQNIIQHQSTNQYRLTIFLIENVKRSIILCVSSLTFRKKYLTNFLVKSEIEKIFYGLIDKFNGPCYSKDKRKSAQ